MSTQDLDFPELDRPAETVYRGVRDGELSHAYVNEQGDLVEEYQPQVFVSEPDSHEEYPLLPRRELSNSTPQSHFEWGYQGHEPHLLAVSLLADAYGDDEFAVEQQDQAVEQVSQLDSGEDWELLAKDVDDFIREVE